MVEHRFFLTVTKPPLIKALTLDVPWPAWQGGSSPSPCLLPSTPGFSRSFNLSLFVLLLRLLPCCANIFLILRFGFDNYFLSQQPQGPVQVVTQVRVGSLENYGERIFMTIYTYIWQVQYVAAPSFGYRPVTMNCPHCQVIFLQLTTCDALCWFEWLSHSHNQ